MFLKISSAKNEHSFQWKVHYGTQTSLSKKHPKEHILALLPNLSTFFNLTILHSNATSLVLSNTYARARVQLQTPHLAPHSPLQRKSREETSQPLLALLWTPTQCLELCYTDWVQAYYSSGETSFLNESWNTSNHLKYPWNNLFGKERTFSSGMIVVFCRHPLTAHLPSPRHIFKQIQESSN